MCNQPLVSCIINFLNAEQFFEEAVESVLAQTYDNWELLLVDDGSTDAGTEIAQRYVNQHPQKIHYLEHEKHQNKGTSASRNLGISQAKGEYVAFLDADDIWLPHKLERQVATLEAHPEAGMVYGSLYYWYSWTNDPDDIEKDYVAEIWDFPSNTVLRSPEYLTLFVQEKILIPSPTCIMVRREVVDRVGGFEESFRHLFDDQVFVAKMSLETPIVVVREFFEKYRKHPDSCTAVASNNKVHQFRQAYLLWLETYLSALQIKDTALWKALRRELFPYRHPHIFSLKKRAEEIMRRIGRWTLPESARHGLWAWWQGHA